MSPRDVVKQMSFICNRYLPTFSLQQQLWPIMLAVRIPSAVVATRMVRSLI